MKVIIAGGREFNNYTLLKNTMDQLLSEEPNLEVVSGKARGADKLGEDWAKVNKLVVHPFIPDWNGPLRKGAGYKRNEDMAKFADACVVFWDGKSKGSGHMINLAKKYKLKLKIIKY